MSESQGRGCFFYGCLTFLLVALAVVVGVFFGTRKSIQMVVSNYTEGQPAELPKVSVSPEQLRDLRQRLESAAGGKDESQISLDADEINALLRNSPELKAAGEQVYFQIEGDTMKAQVSLALDQFDMWRSMMRKLLLKGMSGRYLNGSATLDAGIENGELSVKVRDMTAKGKSLPSSFMANLRAENLADPANKNPELQTALQKIERLQVRDGKVRIKFKGPTKKGSQI
jgi:hypothetical protein